MKKTLSAAAICAALTPVASMTLVSEAGAAVSVNGYVRLGYVSQAPDVGEDVSRFDYRGRLNIFAEDQTRFGKLRSTLRLQGTDGSSGTTDANVGIDRALIQVGNLRFGYSDSWQTTFHGYGNPIERNDGDYGFDQAFFIDYSGSVGGFSYGIGIQDTDDAPDADALAAAIAAGTPEPNGTTNGNFDPYFGVGFSAAGFGIKASFLSDSEAGEGQFKISASGSVAGLDVNLWHRDQTDANRYGTVASSGFGLKYTFSPAVQVGVGFSTNDNLDTGDIAATLFWTPAPGLQVRPEVVAFDDDTFEFGVRMYRRF